MAGNDRLREVLYELVTVGGYVKVTAVDPASGLEVCIVGSPHAGERILKDTALKKLRHVLEKRGRGEGGRTV